MTGSESNTTVGAATGAAVEASTRMALGHAIEAERERLLTCVHCGFCLPACPTYNRLGDEADSPRGRLHLMRAVADGRLDAGGDAFQTHIDRCLGCRACEPVCPSGVEYGALLELARSTAAAHRRPGWMTRALLGVFAGPVARSLFFLVGRGLRASGLAAAALALLPAARIWRAPRLAFAMLASSGPARGLGRRGHADGAVRGSTDTVPSVAPGSRGRVGLLAGCVQQGLFSRVNEATARVLEVNGFEVLPVRGQDCCGALHAHGGDLERARRMAATNVGCFTDAAVDFVVVTAAGCGAAMKEYAHLVDGVGRADGPAAVFAGQVRDVTELLAEIGPRRGATVSCVVAYDHPCHLLHAQGIERAPLDVLAAVPGVEVRVVEGASECCGGAGIYGLTHADLGSRIGGDKVAAVREAGADLVATPNPGCMMQIGAGLRLEGAHESVVHPVEILDESYRRAGYYS